MLKFITSGASKIRDKLVLKVLKSLLGPYVVGLDSRNFQVNLISGTVSLHDLELRKDALAFLDLPIGVDRGGVQLTIPAPKGPVRVISFHGMADKIVAYDANTKSAFPGLVSAPDSVAETGSPSS